MALHYCSTTISSGIKHIDSRLLKDGEQDKDNDNGEDEGEEDSGDP